MNSLAPRLLVLMACVSLTACAPEVKQSAQTEQADQAKPAPTPGAGAPTATPPAPAPTPAPRPAPATTQRTPPAQPAPAVTPPAPPTPAPAPQAKGADDAQKVLIVSVGRANMRDKPDAKAKILQVLTKGTKVVVVSKGNQWYRVRLADGAEGWVAESVVTPAP
jgi:uncharacterized protein YgiM (DUF1202 family)